MPSVCMCGRRSPGETVHGHGGWPSNRHDRAPSAPAGPAAARGARGGRGAPLLAVMYTSWARILATISADTSTLWGLGTGEGNQAGRQAVRRSPSRSRRSLPPRSEACPPPPVSLNAMADEVHLLLAWRAMLLLLASVPR